MKILSVCGSLRAGSANASLQQAAEKLLPEHRWQRFEISLLPYFDPDTQFSAQTPYEVLELRRRAAEADGIFVFTPEYAHGLPGILKNAFEWMFHEGTQKKPVYVAIGSAEGENTQSQLIEILSTMDFVINDTQVLLLKGLRATLGPDGSFKTAAAETAFVNFCRKCLAPDA